MANLQWVVIEANLNPVTGAEQKGTRAVLIVSNEEHNIAMPNVTVLPFEVGPFIRTARGLN
jgi:mRNA interferase MazF